MNNSITNTIAYLLLLISNKYGMTNIALNVFAQIFRYSFVSKSLVCDTEKLWENFHKDWPHWEIEDRDIRHMVPIDKFGNFTPTGSYKNFQTGRKTQSGECSRMQRRRMISWEWIFWGGTMNDQNMMRGWQTISSEKKDHFHFAFHRRRYIYLYIIYIYSVSLMKLPITRKFSF